MKIAVLISGNLRTWEKTKSTFSEFFSNHDIEIFVHTYNIKYRYHPAVQAQLPKFQDEHLSYDEAVNQFSSKLAYINYNDISVVSDIDKSQFDAQMANLGENCLHPIVNVLSSLEDIAKYEHDNDVLFDYVVRVRPDAVYRDGARLDLPVHKNVIYINNGLVYPNDWFLCATRSQFQQIYQNLYAEFERPSSEKSFLRPPHGIFETVFEALHLQVTQKPYVQGLLRADGFLDNFISLNKRQSVLYYLRKFLRRLLRKVRK
jgi:hypothetical protein